MLTFAENKYFSRLNIFKIAISLLVIVSIILLTSFIVKSNTTSPTALSDMGTLTIRVRTTEPESESPYIFRITSGDTNENLRSMRITLDNDYKQAKGLDGETFIFDDSRVDDEFAQLPVYETSATVRLYKGNYKIELPSDSRWRYDDMSTCLNQSYNEYLKAIEDGENPEVVNNPDTADYPYPDQTLVRPHANYAGMVNNRIEIYNTGTDDITVIINLPRKNERWLSRTVITEGFTTGSQDK